MTKISFPGLNIGEFQIDPVAFRIPIGEGIEVRWYGILIVLGMILAFTYCAYRSKQEGVCFDDLLDIAIFTIIFAVIGARAYYVLTSLDEYNSFSEMIAIWNGGIAIYGAIIAGAITIFVVCRVKKYSLNKTAKFFDSVAPAVMIGQILGRWGNFCNGEAFGSTTTLPWRMCSDSFANYLLRKDMIDINVYTEMLNGTVGVHPTFFYESMWNLVGFILIHFLYKKKKFDGQIVLMYLTWYGFGRMFIEGLRTDSLYVGFFRISQLVGFLCFAICGTILVLGLIKASKKQLATNVCEAEESSNEPALDVLDDQVAEEIESENEEIKENNGEE